MAKTTPKQTGGGGFEFESKVAAFFISHLLADVPTYGGQITIIAFQTRNDGWLFDDLLLTIRKHTNDYNVAVSSKSNPQFTTSGVPKDVNRDLWTQFLNDQNAVFNTSRDYIALIVTPLSRRVFQDISELIAWASANDPSTLQKRVYSNKLSEPKRKIFNSFKCPIDLAKRHKVKQSDTWVLLSRIFVTEFDFESHPSKDENFVVETCRNCLSNKNRSEAETLYTKIKDLRNALAPVSGKLNYDDIVERFRYDHKLVGFPEHSHDWKKITSHSKSKINAIPAQIGGKLQLARNDAMKDLQSMTNVFDTVFILGRSGTGKSILASKFTTAKLEQGIKVIWVDGFSLENELENFLRLENSIVELTTKIQDSEAYIVIDGIDRFFKEPQLNHLNKLLEVSKQPNSPWKYIYTCQAEDFEDVLGRLHRHNINLKNFNDYEIGEIDEQDIVQIVTEFPAFADLFKHDHLTPVLSNLKYLDLMAYNSSRIKEIKSAGASISETDIIDWIWHNELAGLNTTQASRFLQRLADIQAQTLKLAVPLSEFDVAELTPSSDLIAKKIIRENEERLSFTHDLFCDWAIYKLIRSNQDQLKAFLNGKQMLSPLWSKGVRLYGVCLLSKDSTGKEWTNAFERFDEQVSSEKIIQDLLLESLLFSAQTQEHIDSLWDKLTQNEGTIFRRFLHVFLYRATIPNSKIIKLAKEKGFDLALAINYDRDLKYLYWCPVILALHKHKADSLTLFRSQIAIIANEWLRKTPVNFPCRKECADLAVESATWLYETERSGTFVSSEITKIIYKPLLAAINEKTSEVTQLLRRLCKRDNSDFLEKEDNKDRPTPKSRPEKFKIREAKPWQHGPFARVDDGLEEICLNEDSLIPVVRHSPQLASEILLALLIDPPKEIYYGYDHHYKFDINEPRKWFPPFYTRGPFLNFLRIQPNVAMDTIIALVNFMTERWSTRMKGAVPQTQLNMDGSLKQYIGDQSVYFWFRDVGSAPHAIVSALMAIEKYLIEQIDADKSISPHLVRILTNGNSVSYLGLLVSIGKYKPALFLKELNLLLSPLEFYIWERMMNYQAFGGHQMIGWTDASNSALAKEWHELPHRKQLIETTGMVLSINYTEIRKQYERIVSQWRTRTDMPEVFDAYTQNLFHYFDPKNFTIQEQEDKLLLIYNEPQEITEKFKEARLELEENSDIDLFAFRCYNYIKDQKVFSTDEIEVIWSKVQSFDAYDDDNLYHALRPKLHAMFGGIVILLQNQSQLKEASSRKKWINDFVAKSVTNWHPERNEFSTLSIDYHWEQFCASCLPLLWKDDLLSVHIKSVIADFTLKASYDTVKKLFGALSKYFKWSDKDFVQLQNLVIERAVRPSTELSTKTVHNKLIDDFVRAKFPIALENWNSRRRPTQSIRDDSHLGYARYHRQHVRRDSGLDDKLIANAFSDFPFEIDRNDKASFEYTQMLWTYVAEHLAFKIGEPENNRLFNYELNTFDTWALKRLAHLVVELHEEDKLEKYWLPILAYGIAAKDFAEPFTRYFFFFNIEDKKRYDRFFRQWDAMLEFAYTSANWKRNEVNSREYDELWASIIGLSYNQIDIWKTDLQEFIKRGNPQLKKWSLKNVYNQNAIRRILQLIRSISGESFIKDGIIFVSGHLKFQEEIAKVPVPDGLVRIGFEHNDTLASTLRHLWENKRPLIKDDPQLFTAFKFLVTYLVSIQNPIGLDIQDRILEV